MLLQPSYHSVFDCAAELSMSGYVPVAESPGGHSITTDHSWGKRVSQILVGLSLKTTATTKNLTKHHRFRLEGWQEGLTPRIGKPYLRKRENP